MKLMTKELLEKLPKLGETENQKDPVALVKFFTPWSNWTWYVTEYDGEDTFFGLVHGFEEEFGYFSLKELQSLKGPLGLGIERDLYWQPKPISQILKK